MFSSNQVLEVSGCISNVGELESALEFALKFSDNDSIMKQERIDKGFKLLYQITEDGKYCIGWGLEKNPEGWLEYPFRFEVGIVCKIIRQHLEQYSIERGIWAGSYEKGFIMKCIDEYLGPEKDGVKSPFYGIVSFEPYTCFYSK